MGGGVAYQSASNGVPIVMKDIRQEAIDAGLAEASKLLGKQVQRGKLKPEGVMSVLNAIQPALSYGEFAGVDLVVEAVVENPKVKASVLSELEDNVSDDTIVTTNTSTISVNLLAKSLKRPENFCGMHFFNPVHRMPLVEVIRAEGSSERAIATTVAYAQAMKKTPIVVEDCPGFLVNRILFAYFGGFNRLIADGGKVVAIDKAMERFGWPMGPAYLLDVVGLDTGKHAAAGHGGGLSRAHGRRAHGQRRAHRHRRDVRGRALRAEERPRLLQVRAGQEGQAAEAGRSRRRRDRRERAGVGEGLRGRRHRRPAHGADVRRGGPVPGGRHRRDAGRGRHGPRLRARLPAVPGRGAALGGRARHGGLRGSRRCVVEGSRSAVRADRSACARWRPPTAASTPRTQEDKA